MNDNKVQFDEFEHSVSIQRVERDSLVDFLIKKGFVKDKQQAMYILLGFVVLLIISSLFIFKASDSRFINEDVDKEYEEYMLTNP